MIKKIGGFLEEHVEKIILIIVGLLCSWLLITRVLLTPNIVEYRSEKYGPGNIDEKILQILREKENEKDVSLIDIQLPEERNYAELLKNPLGDINPVFPGGPGLPKDKEDSFYDEPDIAMIKVTDVEREHIRSVVYEPVIEVTGDSPYDESDCEPNDIDFVTVSGYLNISEIVEEFERCYPDPCMAKPVFASVNLQRQQKNSDGQWSDWKNVPRTKIDYNRNLFKVVETFSDLPLGGLKIYKFQLNNILTQLELLQPEPYQIASAGEEWLPPMLHRELISAKKKDEREAKKQESAEQKTTASTTGGRRGGRERNTSRTGGTGSTLTGTATRGGSTRRGGTTSRGSRGRSGTTDTRTNPRLTNDLLRQGELNVDQVYDDFESIVLTDDTDLTEISEPILFWAHDDTVEPDNTYRYRIRVGLLNPTAEEERDKIIFWTDFSDETDEVDIPGKMYFFAMGDVQETAKTVSVSVYKLALGYWYKKVFDRVAQGEMIGDIVENERKDSDTNDDNEDTASSEEPETIDFTTGAIMVDVVRASARIGESSMDPLPYYDMLYSYDGIDIRHMPVTRTANSKIWPPDLYDDYRYVQEHINDKREPFQAWGASEIEISQVRGGLQSRIGIRGLR